MSTLPFAALSGVGRHYRRGSTTVTALDGVDLEVYRGEFLAVTGPSGSGKSTLLAILGCLDRPTAGTYSLEGRPVEAMTSRELAGVRNRTFGFVFQAFHLIPALSVLDNVETPLVYGDLPRRQWRSRACECLEAVGLLARADHLPAELSGGESQRAALARALVTAPRVVLADEPTGNLDAATGSEILHLLAALNRAGTTLVVVTHNPDLAAAAGRRVRLAAGRVAPPAPER